MRGRSKTPLRSNPTSQLTSAQAPLQEAMLLFSYAAKAPKSILRQIAPHLARIATYFHQPSLIAAFDGLSLREDQVQVLTEQGQQVFEQYVQLLNLTALSSLSSQLEHFSPTLRPSPRPKRHQQGSSQKRTPGINLIEPEYHMKQRLAASQSQQKSKKPRFEEKDCKESQVYQSSRFTVRLEELLDLQSSHKQQGNIILLRFNGHLITGGKTYIVLKEHKISVWNKESKDYSHIINPTEKKIITDRPSADSQSHQEDPMSEQSWGLKQVLIGHTGKVTCASLSSDELYLVTGGVDRTVRLWCLRMSTQLACYRCHSSTIWDVHFNPSGLFFLSGAADDMVALWKTNAARPVRLFKHGSDVYKVSFARNPTYALSAGQDSQVKIWNLETGQLTQTLSFAKPVVNFTVGHSGQYLLVLQVDGRASLHDLFHGQLMLSFYFYSQKKGKVMSHKTAIIDAAWSWDERQIAVVTHKHVVVYPMETMEKMSQRCMGQKEEKEWKERAVTPQEVVYVGPNLRLNYCQFAAKGLLVVGALNDV